MVNNTKGGSQPPTRHDYNQRLTWEMLCSWSTKQHLYHQSLIVGCPALLKCLSLKKEWSMGGTKYMPMSTFDGSRFLLHDTKCYNWNTYRVRVHLLQPPLLQPPLLQRWSRKSHCQPPLMDSGMMSGWWRPLTCSSHTTLCHSVMSLMARIPLW